MQKGSLVEYIGHPDISNEDNLRVLSQHGYVVPSKNYPYLVIDGPISINFVDGPKPAIRIEGWEMVGFWCGMFRELQPPLSINIEELVDEMVCY